MDGVRGKLCDHPQSWGRSLVIGARAGARLVSQGAGQCCRSSLGYSLLTEVVGLAGAQIWGSTSQLPKTPGTSNRHLKAFCFLEMRFKYITQEQFQIQVTNPDKLTHAFIKAVSAFTRL